MSKSDYIKGVEDGKKGKISDALTDAYTIGLEDAWEVTAKIYSMSAEQRMRLLGHTYGYEPFKMNVVDAIRKLKLNHFMRQDMKKKALEIIYGIDLQNEIVSPEDVYKNFKHLSLADITKMISILNNCIYEVREVLESEI